MILPPLHEVLPKNDPSHHWETGLPKPDAGRRVGYARQDRKLFGIQCLIKRSLLHDRFKADAMELFVLTHNSIAWKLCARAEKSPLLPAHKTITVAEDRDCLRGPGEICQWQIHARGGVGLVVVIVGQRELLAVWIACPERTMAATSS